MFETLKALYDNHRINDQDLIVAVQRGWITQEQFDIIVGK